MATCHSVMGCPSAVTGSPSPVIDGLTLSDEQPSCNGQPITKVMRYWDTNHSFSNGQCPSPVTGSLSTVIYSLTMWWSKRSTVHLLSFVQFSSRNTRANLTCPHYHVRAGSASPNYHVRPVPLCTPKMCREDCNFVPGRQFGLGIFAMGFPL